MAGVIRGMIVGVTTEVIAGEGLILTAGGIDTHIHYICPQQAYEAIAAGLTTMVGGGTGPATGTCATTCTPGAHSPAHDAAGDRCPAAEFRLHRQGEHLHARRDLAEQIDSRRDRVEAARGLGHHPRRHRLLPERRRAI